MEIEEILESVKIPIEKPDNDNNEIEIKREKLVSAVIGGGKYLEKKITVEALNNMSNEEIEKEFEKYERKLGSVMVKTLGRGLIELYTTAVSKVLPIPFKNKSKLVEELNEDPFLDHALNKTCCELYYRYGMFLAPLTTSLTTLKYCDFNTNKNGDERGPDTTGDFSNTTGDFASTSGDTTNSD